MPKTPDEIKKGVECCVMPVPRPCAKCPYHLMDKCLTNLLNDALALIQQLQAENAELSGKIGRLEAERDALFEEVRRCSYCIYEEGVCGECGEHCEPCEADCPCRECDFYSNFVWRGVQKEE